ncbi:MAG: 1-(5-phosphoribosyl)-5-[(5-phosphoribosylamino)methylideneamino]imidazole-4-carboxamide isomerase [Ruminococcaceae bacterium]|nr:1-(5-phosphoribosyl)-5-[(5-phosphoribosylamino)methylideneamino]imidazole-4-carboxamide isomerase [Oscillospiraceae bacterium]
MNLFPAIDLYGGKAVRLYKGNYNEMTVYNDNPVSVAKDFEACGAKYIHLVDLEGAKTGETPNLETVRAIVSKTQLFAEIGGGIRSMETVERYLSVGVSRVILGTAAVKNEEFLREAVKKYGEKIAVGVDIRDGFVAIHGWTENSALHYTDFMRKLTEIGVKTVIVTDISRDGAMQGTNRSLYAELAEKFPEMQVIASGGVSSLDDVCALKQMNLYGAIIGKAYYAGAIDLTEAVKMTE